MSQHLDEDLLAYLDRALSSEALATLDAHVEACEICQHHVASTQKILGVLGQEKPLEPSEAFDRSLFRRLDELDQIRPWYAVILGSFWRPIVWAPALAAAGLALAFWPRQEGPVAPPTLAEADPDLLQDLEFYQDFSAIENLDVLDDLDVIESMEDAG